MTIYDLMIIGGGPAGYLAAERATHGELSTLLFEKRALGGVCLNEGCIPTKTLLHSAKLYDHAKHGAVYGVTVESVSIDHSAVIARKDKVVKTLVAGVNAKMKGQKVTVIKETAVITGKSEGGFAVRAGDKVYEAKRLLLAAGSEAVIPSVPGIKEGLESGFVMTNREILNMAKLPGKLTIIGGGVIGLEMAAYFAMVGVKVTVVEMMGKTAGYTDGEISDILQKELTAKGIDFFLNSKVTKINNNSIEYEKGGIHTVEADVVLLSVGRKASTDGLGLESIGIYTDHGAVVTDHHLRTNVPNVYAAGDINGKSMLAHTAYREAEVAVNHMLDKRDYMRYDAIPSVIYTSPEVASVGETEETAKEKGITFIVKKLPMIYSGRFVAENDGTGGLCKLLIETGSNRLIGVHIIGSYASEMIYGTAMMIESRWSIEDLREIVFPHPTVSEIIKETLFV